VCKDWYRWSFQHLPDVLAHYRNPKNKSIAETGVVALIQYLNNKGEEEKAAEFKIS
jgi:hypothetical protein